MFIFFLSFLSLHFINCVCRVSCLYELCSLLFSSTYIQLQFPFPIFFFTVYLNFGPLFLCVSSSIAFYLLTFFEFPDLRPFSQKHPDFRLIFTELSFHMPSHPYLHSKPQPCITLQETLRVKTESRNNMLPCACDSNLQL